MAEASRGEGRQRPERDWTDVESEGVPVLEDQPPGIGPETAEEGLIPPGDYLFGADDPDVTVAGQQVRESVRQRADREQPEGLVPPDDPGGRLVAGAPDPSGEELGEWEDDDDAGLSPEERAVHVEPE